MGHSNYKLGLFSRSVISVAVSLCFASIAHAQSAEGSIFGHTASKGQVTVESLDTGSKRQIQAESSGAFALGKLPPGRYKVTAGGVEREVSVSLGSGTEVKFNEPTTVVVSGSRHRSAIDVSSTETNTVFNAEQLHALPVSRDVNAVAILAPGVVKGDADLGAGGLPAVAGASVAENGYYINGFDVTNIRNFLSYANLPFDAINEEQIKSGGYSAEYGRSLGAVISIVTKRGTNTWKGGAAVYFAPDALESKGKNVKNLDYPGTYTVFHENDKSQELSYNAYVGGPIIKDKLFIFALAEGHNDRKTTFRQDQSHVEKSAHPNGMVKLDFLPNADHRFEFTGITNQVDKEVTDYTHPDDQKYATSNVGTSAVSHLTSGGNTLIGKYTGYITDNFNLSALVGKSSDKVEKTTGARVASLSCPTVLDLSLNEVGCWVGPYPGGPVRDPKAPDDEDSRRAFRVDGDYTLGDHTFRGGVDIQKFKSASAGSLSWSNGQYYRYFKTATGTINGVKNAAAAGSTYVRLRTSSSTSGKFAVNNDAYYVEDSWKAMKNVVLYGGMRWESFDNQNGDGITFIKADKLPAPRLGASWDVNSDSSLKVYGNAGRYYIPVASNTNIRATRGEQTITNFYTFTGIDPRTQAPTGMSAPIGNPQLVGDGSLPNPATIADTKLKPMSQDEYILGFQKALTKEWTLGVKATHRKVQNGMDDTCSHMGYEQWAADNGYKNFDSSTMAQCMIVNPGNDVTLQVDLNNDGKLSTVTFPAKYIDLEKYTRTYKAVEFTLDHPFDGKWGLNASYTWSKTMGTAEGYVNSVINQEDPGVTQDFDFPSLTRGSNGYTSNDRRHVFKAYGNYALNDDWRIGFNAMLSSGRPTSCIGFVPDTAKDYGDAAGYSTASSYYCLNDKGVSELHNRGTAGRTPWTNSVDLNVAYMPKMTKGKLTVQMDVFNVFNTQQVIETQETRDFSRDTTTSAEPGKLSQNYGQPTSFQAPRSVRFTARYEF